MRGRLTIAEIREQPEVLSRLLDVERTSVIRLARKLRRRRPAAVFLAARGASDNAALYGHYLFETVLGIPSGLASPSVVTIYRKVPRLRGTLVLGLSQSGRSSDIVRYLEAARAACGWAAYRGASSPPVATTSPPRGRRRSSSRKPRMSLRRPCRRPICCTGRSPWSARASRPSWSRPPAHRGRTSSGWPAA